MTDNLFYKYQGTGNDFVIALVDHDNPPSFDRSKIKKICDRRYGIGADGFVALKKVPVDPTDKGRGPEFRWDFYNSDGSNAEMCGNAARCVGLFVSDHLKISGFTLFTKAGPVAITQDGTTDTKIKVQLASPKLVQETPFVLVNSGVPHILIEKDSIEDLGQLRSEATTMRKHAQFPKNGANVTFLSQKAGSNEVHSITFERGVDDFTLSCGTGALAASYFCEMKSKDEKSAPWKVLVPGGALEIQFNGSSAQLVGPAVKVAEIKLSETFFRP